MSVKPIPEGFHSVTPYLITKGIPQIIDFLKSAFDAVELDRMVDRTGRVMHAMVKIGDSIIMMGETMEGFPAIQSSLYLYVTDTDSVYKKAIEAGGISLMKPADQFYGDRNAGVQDSAGNKWWIATHVEDISREELERRALERK
ncbi:MAG: VOC family protein [Ignavibacteriales bacterium]|nr:VOC family protein [Ignavibacteriales bacterium]